MRLNFTVTSNSITLFYKGMLYNIPSTFRKFAELKDHLRSPEHDPEYIESIVNVKKEIERLSQGNVKIVGESVTYKDKPIRTSLASRLVQLFDEGFEVTPWINFMENVMLNPSDDARERLFTFLEKNESPFTEDGHFLAFKRIRKNWTDIHSGTMDNSVGNIVEVDRSEVNADNSVTCSYGLHVAASIYLDRGPTQFTNTTNSRTIVCKVNPRDVVAVPPDYNETKMRVCRYEVLSEIEVGTIKDVESQNLHQETKVVEDIEVENDYYVLDTSEDWDTLTHSEKENKLLEFVKSKMNYNLTISYDAYYDVVHVSIVMTENQFATDGFKAVEILHDLEFEDADIEFSGEIEVGNNVTFYMDDLEAETTDGDSVEMEEYSQNEFDEMINLMVENGDLNLSLKPSETITTPEEDKLVFIRGGNEYSSKEILSGVAKFGSINAWAKYNGIPRSTAQDWVKKITNS